jgi:hypothetical protein
MLTNSNLLQLTEKMAVCSVTLKDEKIDVCVYATALATETPFYADLAQKRALEMAWKYAQEGISGVTSAQLPSMDKVVKSVPVAVVPSQSVTALPAVTNTSSEEIASGVATSTPDDIPPVPTDEIPW